MAARFWIGGAANSNWNENTGSLSNWSATSGGTIRVAPPTVSDDVTFDGVGITANSASTISATISCLSLTFAAGYTNTVTKNAVLTIAGNLTDNTAHSWAGASGITISAASTITSGGKTFSGPVSFTGANTKTLSGDWTISGILTLSTASGVVNKTTAETLNCGGLTVSGANSGTITINVNNGTWSGVGVLTVSGLTISGTSTVSGSVAFNTGTLTNNSSTTTTTGSTLSVNASTTLNTNGIIWNNVTLGGTSTFTINSLFSVSGTVTNATAITFAGSSGFSFATFTLTHTSVTTITFANTVTYTITTAFNAFSSRVGSILLFTSDHASNKAILTLQSASTTCNVLASFTRIDASAGRPIVSFNGTITTCFNIYSQTNALFRPIESYERKSRRNYLANKNRSVIYQ